MAYPWPASKPVKSFRSRLSRELLMPPHSAPSGLEHCHLRYDRITRCKSQNAEAEYSVRHSSFVFQRLSLLMSSPTMAFTLCLVPGKLFCTHDSRAPFNSYGIGLHLGNR